MINEEAQLRIQAEVWWDETAPQIIKDGILPMISRKSWNQISKHQQLEVMLIYAYGDKTALLVMEEIMSRFSYHPDWRIRNAKCPKCKSKYPVYHPEERHWNCEKCGYTRMIRRMKK